MTGAGSCPPSQGCGDGGGCGQWPWTRRGRSLSDRCRQPPQSQCGGLGGGGHGDGGCGDKVGPSGAAWHRDCY